MYDWLTYTHTNICTHTHTHTQHMSGEAATSSTSLSTTSHQGPPTHADSTASLPSLPSLPNKDTRRKPGQRKSGGARWGAEHGEFTRQDKAEQLVGAVERIQENNTFLRDMAW